MNECSFYHIHVMTKSSSVCVHKYRIIKTKQLLDKTLACALRLFYCFELSCFDILDREGN